MGFTSRFIALLDTLPDAVRAGFWITLSGAGFTLMMAIARKLAPDLHILIIVFFRSLFGVAFLLPLLLRAGPGMLRTKKHRPICCAVSVPSPV